MTETEFSVEASRSVTVNAEVLLSKKQLAEASARDGCFIIEEPINVSDELDFTTGSCVSSEISDDVSRKMLPSITRVSNKFPAQDSFLLMQKWEGVVTQIGDDSFLATLRDISAGGEDEEAEIFTEEISPADMSLLGKGAVFYWCIGYRDTLTGQRIRASEIRFRRLPAWSKRELDAAQKEAEELSDLLKWK
jgi:hypothetical protein